MRGKWAEGIVPRSFAWVIRDRLAVSERLGGYGTNHRRVRRQEEIIWAREQGFTRVVSLLPSPHNLHAYDELKMPWHHAPFGPGADSRDVLARFYPELQAMLDAGERLLVHHEEMGDKLQGTIGGYLVFSGLVPQRTRAIAMVERLLERQMGSEGRELVAVANRLATAAKK